MWRESELGRHQGQRRRGDELGPWSRMPALGPWHFGSRELELGGIRVEKRERMRKGCLDQELLPSGPLPDSQLHPGTKAGSTGPSPLFLFFELL